MDRWNWSGRAAAPANCWCGFWHAGRADLHVVDGELPHPKLPLVPGHEVVGTVVERGAGAVTLSAGARVGIGWLGQTCGTCRYCLAGSVNLCDAPEFTGYT